MIALMAVWLVALSLWKYDVTLARLTHVLGAILILLALLWAGVILVRQLRRPTWCRGRPQAIIRQNPPSPPFRKGGLGGFGHSCADEIPPASRRLGPIARPTLAS
jgi:hypothetical protein